MNTKEKIDALIAFLQKHGLSYLNGHHIIFDIENKNVARLTSKDDEFTVEINDMLLGF